MNAPARTLGGYRLVAGLGMGGMARVYLAMSRKPGGFTKLLVLKVLRTDLNAEEELLAMFMHEARIAARLNHPNVVQTYEVGEDAGRYFIAMEYLEGQPLSSVIARVGRANLPAEIELRILCDILDGLHYAHELTDYDGTPLGIVHRDVSPQNIFVTYTGQGRLVDFGIAKVAGSVHTQSGIIKGKVGYFAPEQATGKVVDRRADIFAVGVHIWEMLTGRRFVQRHEDEVVALTRRISGADPRVRDVVPDAPAELAEICEKAMAPSPDARFATAAEMRDALEAYLRKGPPVDARRVAALLDDHFASERARIRGLIDEQLKSSDATQPMIDLAARASVTPPSSVISAARATRGRRLSPALAAAGASLVLGAVAFGVAGRRGRNVAAVPSVRVAAPSSSEALPVAASGVAPPADARDVASATVAIRTVPPTATLAFDGKRVGNPYHATLAKDGRTHTLQVAAPGFLPELRALVIDRDRDEVITLLRAPAVAPTATNPTKRPQRTIDDQDPYQ